MSDQENNFDAGDSGSSDCIPVQVGSLKKGGYVMLKGNPCRITQYSTAKPGKHGSAKATIVGIDIFTNKKYEDTAPTGANCFVPQVIKTQYQVLDINQQDDFVTLFVEGDEPKTDLRLPQNDAQIREQLLKVYKQHFDSGQVWFTVQKSCKQEKIISGRGKA